MATATINGMTTFGSSGSGADAGWGDFGGGPGAGQDTDDFIEGTDARGGRKTVSGRGIDYTLASGNVDMSTTTTHLFVWILVKSISNLQTIASGGITLRVGSSSGNYRSFYIGGSDTVKPGWQCYIIDPTKTGSVADTGTPNMAQVTYVGYDFQWATTPGGTSNNVVVDIIRYTTGPYVTGGTSGDRLTWDDIATADEASAFGIFNRQKASFFVNGRLALGAPSGTGDFYLDDDGQLILWAPQNYEDGTNIVTSMAAGYNALIVQEGTGTTDIEDGILVGSGDDRTGYNGSVFKKDPLAVDGSTANPDTLDLNLSGQITAVDMHGTLFGGFDGTTTTLSDDATDGPNHVYAGCTFSGNEMIDSGRVVIRSCIFSAYTGTAAAFNWQANADIKNSSFLGNTDGTNDPAGIQHATEGDFNYIGLTFSGNDVDVRNTNNATQVDTYATTNGDTGEPIGGGQTNDGIGQSFTWDGTAGQLVKVLLSLRKVGTPTGNATINIYAHSGTYGTSSVPTGASLKASSNLDVSTLTGSFADTTVFFEAAAFFDGAASTQYVITFEYTGGDGSNYVEVEYDGSSPGHGGNKSTRAVSGGAWSAQSGHDVVFVLWRDGEVQVNASAGANPSLKSRDGSPSSAIAIINTVTLSMTVKDADGDALEGIRCRIDESPGGALIAEGTTNASGVFSDASFNYSTDQAVRARARLKGFRPFEALDTITSSGLAVPVTMQTDPAVELP